MILLPLHPVTGLAYVGPFVAVCPIPAEAAAVLARMDVRVPAAFGRSRTGVIQLQLLLPNAWALLALRLRGEHLHADLPESGVWDQLASNLSAFARHYRTRDIYVLLVSLDNAGLWATLAALR